MKQGIKPVSALSAIGGAFHAIRTNFKSCLIIAVFTMLLPQLVTEIFFSLQAKSLILELQGVISAMGDTDSFRLIIESSGKFFSTYLVLLFLFFVLFATGYFALIELFRLDVEDGSDIVNLNFRNPSIMTSLRRGLSLCLPSGLVFFGLLGALATVGQSLFHPFIFATVLSLMGPVLMVFEDTGALRALWKSIFLRYPRPEGMASRWSIFFAVSGLAAFFYTGLTVVLYLGQLLLNLDQIIPISRGIWVSTIGELPFSVIYGVTEILISTLVVTLICFLPAASAQLYYQINFKELRFYDIETPPPDFNADS